MKSKVEDDLLCNCTRSGVLYFVFLGGGFPGMDRGGRITNPCTLISKTLYVVCKNRAEPMRYLCIEGLGELLVNGQ